MKNIYVKLARSAIENYIKSGKEIDVPKDLPKEMTEKTAGVFVSIHKKNIKEGEEDLRGCIGTILATNKNIAEEIIENAIAAATLDNRFPPVKKGELDDLEITVDVLGEPEPIEGISSLNPKKYGVIVKSHEGKSGLLLPDIEGVDSPEYQIAIARQKAGIMPNEPVYLYRFEVMRYKE